MRNLFTVVFFKKNVRNLFQEGRAEKFHFLKCKKNIRTFHFPKHKKNLLKENTRNLLILTLESSVSENIRKTSSWKKYKKFF